MKLKEFRKTKKMTQRDLADRFNVSNITVSRWESGTQTPSLETAILLAKFFGCTIDDLVRGQNPTSTPAGSEARQGA